MGGIWHMMPITYGLMWLGSLALAGVPFFAGYYSKDIILESAFVSESAAGQMAFWFGITAAFLTAFYSGRLLFMTFHNEPRASKEVMKHVHESPPIMLAPLAYLALGSLFAGALGYYMFGMVSGDSRFWQGTLASHETIHLAHHVPMWVKWLPIVMGAGGLALSWNLYMRRKGVPAKLAAKFPKLYQFLLNKWYIDELYDAMFVKPALYLGNYFWRVWDTKIIDGLGPNGAAFVSQLIARRVSRLQTGYVYHYAFAMLIGLLGFISWVVLRV